MSRENEAEKEQKAARKDAFLKLGLFLVALLLIVDTIQISRFGAIVESVNQYNKGVVDEMGGFRQDIMLFGNDINDMRQYLLMPKSDYSFLNEMKSSPEVDEQQLSTAEQAAYKYLSDFIGQKQAEINSRLAEETINSLYKNEILTNSLTAQSLSAGQIASSEDYFNFKINENEKPMVNIIAEKNTGKIFIESNQGKQEIKNAEDLVKYVDSHKEKILTLQRVIGEAFTNVIETANQQEIKTILAKKKLTFLKDPTQTADAYLYAFNDSDSLPAVIVAVNKKDGSISLISNNSTPLQIAQKEDLSFKLLEILNNLDTSSEQEKIIKSRRDEIENLFKEEAFQELLKSSGMQVQTQPREEYNKLLYDVKDEKGKIQFSYVLELSSGLYKIMKDNQEIDFNSILEDGSKKKS
jgi:hypothetical protein